jgi:polyisoprenoid-binding protein YceI
MNSVHSQVNLKLTRERLMMKQLVTTLALAFLFTFTQAQTTYTLSEGTQARFYINEVLLGNDKTVEGVTSDVTGEIQFDLTNPSAATVGVITINARDLTTDDNRRNGQIQNRILQSAEDQYQYITFEPTSITGLPETVAVGDTFNVQMTGNLTIRGVTLEKTFDVAVTVASESQLTGLGTATITHQEFELSIPRVPIVASVEDEVRLELEFNAVAAN